MPAWLQGIIALMPTVLNLVTKLIELIKNHPADVPTAVKEVSDHLDAFPNEKKSN